MAVSARPRIRGWTSPGSANASSSRENGKRAGSGGLPILMTRSPWNVFAEARHTIARVVFRVCVECPGCSTPVLFRIAVSGEAEQSFAAACPHCEATLRGILRTLPDRGRITGLDIDGSPASLIEEPDGVAVINVGTDLLTHPAPQSMVDPDGSPFLMHVSGLGHDVFLNWRSRTEGFFEVVEAYWASISRLWGYYTAGNWDFFDSHARKYWSGTFPADPEPIQRHDAIHRALELIFLHVAGVEYVKLNHLVRGDFPGEHPDDVLSLARTPDNLLFAFRRCHNYIAGTEGKQKPEAFWELLKLISRLDFFVTPTERSSTSAAVPAKQRLQKL